MAIWERCSSVTSTAEACALTRRTHVEMSATVAPTRLARRGGVYTLDGRMNLTNARFKRDFAGVDEEFGGYVSENYSRAYLHHLLKAKEFLAGTLCTIHNVEFMIRLVDNIRAAIDGGYYEAYRDEFLGRYYAGK